MNIRAGDWVTGHTGKGELVHGYVASIDTFQGTIAIQVTDSDHEAAIGKEISLPNRAVRRLPEESIDREEDLLALIDLALATYDEPWFTELSSKLSALRSQARRQELRRAALSARNRLGSRFAN
ncbi:IDEAL domain-containing protein [Cohnella lubricantis]|uniref:IDEAL domain-containing protein n=1 Tax=Cohnella lubricantis TaxID=2163172 RepID=A0A841TEN9_9BACL|nr:IDEAL domain-containing protein [Cohnella lubricantis]MBB6676931.1 IDEAL domain-containing protein [Cohnella lubricantis]MBP2118335.1 hypothetical protein [Cohnella lubricantis]